MQTFVRRLSLDKCLHSLFIIAKAKYILEGIRKKKIYPFTNLHSIKLYYQRKEQQIIIDETTSQEEWESLLTETETPSCASMKHDPYFKPRSISSHHDCHIDESNSIIVPNFSAWWIPSVTIREEIGGTLYTVTSSFEGNGSLLQKLKRISVKNILESPEDKNDK